MKKILFVFAIVAGSFAANAQGTASKTQFGGGVRAGITIGDFDDFYGAVIGAELQAEHFFSSNVSGTLHTGYFNFSGKDGVDGFGMIPVLAGIRYYPSTTFFIGGRLGLGILTEGGEKTAFNYEPQIGFNGKKVQVALGYNARPQDGFTLSHIGLSAIIKFN